ncbi:PPE protein [Mycobacteroides abscessus subsp. abscessus]|uniref:PPE family protein n=1 Tax=Mycobacteroides abscessus TaxID=36809 RepID=UPI0009264DF3|nr:PPE domain-containing protein [Mycobacteroides abscessus]SIJ21980.1 PPE protein [Mycobacteroides abscessus subsp. abscessus]SLH38674.1 PPE protein [Mycobacteroides abscessus subsp. abscessus]
MAAPPEAHSALLNFGDGPAGIAQAGESWAETAAQYTAAIGELTGILQNVAANYTGESALSFQKAHMPMLVWLSTNVIKATIAAAAHAAIVASYEGSVATMPTLPELAENHMVHGVLVGTNFFGQNTIPIGFNEADYMRMWVLAANVMTGYDGTSTAAMDSIPPTPISPILLVPGAGEASSAAASAAALPALAQGAAGGAALNAADMMGNKQLVEKAGKTPLSFGNAMRGPEGQPNEAGQAPEQLMSGGMQQVTQMIPQAAQGAMSAVQGGPQQILSQAPQLLSQAPQALSQIVSGMGNGAGTGLGGGQAPMAPVGFAGTSAIRGINPAGLTSLAGGAYGSGPAKPMMPSTWGSVASSESSASTNLGRAIAAGEPAMATAGSSGSGAGGGMMGAGAQNRRRSGREVSKYGSPASEQDEFDDAGTAEERGHY